ncbi:tail fiber assembly protein [Falsirhodobacter halotolerans]|uniref:tail fiber assembly protein n=1 Tax=Falsirhodobacter halotolerans TaxID=1146892 RepID=UPI001FCFE6D6|nr:tail fiber assembly protein [Falsirhodobacter halotolerans]MCJ8138441.1 phage tail assembly chaperone [Falsirhodobacter halotolerans]
MSWFVIHDEDGQIVATGQCPACDLSIQYLEPGQALIETDGPISDAHHEVRGGKVCARTGPPNPEDQVALTLRVRNDRDRRLAATDWTQLSDVPDATRARWRIYRQALRDVSDQPGFPGAVVWPEPPTGN